MPGMDGFELLRRVRRHPNLKDVPVIIVSARANTVDEQRMLQLNLPAEEVIDAYLGKPIAPGFLLHTVKEVLVKHKEYLLEKNRTSEDVWV